MDSPMTIIVASVAISKEHALISGVVCLLGGSILFYFCFAFFATF